MVHGSRKKPIVFLRDMSRMRVVFTLFVLFAFALQNFAVQTHIHFSSRCFAGGQQCPARPKIAPLAPLRASLPDFPNDGKDGDASHCPLCQAVLFGGDYLIPAAAQMALPFVYPALDPLHGIALFADAAPSHAWQSRAPPIFRSVF